MSDAAVTDEPPADVATVPRARRRRGWRPGRGVLFVSVVATAVLGFGLGVVLSGRAERLVDDEVALPPPAPPATLVPTTIPRRTTTTTRPVPTTTTGPTTTTTLATTTVTTAVPTTLPPTTVMTVLPTTAPTLPPTTTTTSPVATSVPPGPPGTAASLVVIYAGQAQGVLRLGYGQSSTVVVSNVGGTSGDWSMQASGYVTVRGGNRLSGNLAPGASVGLTVIAADAVPPGVGGALTFTLPNGVAVVPIAIG